MRALLAFVLALVASCDPPPHACTDVAGAPTCADTLRAIEVADDALAASGFTRVGWFAKVQWVAAARLDDPTLDDGLILLGYSGPELTWDGIYCRATIATRDQALASATSLAHELTHCSFVAGCLTGHHCHLLGDRNRGPYQGHTRPEWDVVVPAVRDALVASGMLSPRPRPAPAR